MRPGQEVEGNIDREFQRGRDEANRLASKLSEEEFVVLLPLAVICKSARPVPVKGCLQRPVAARLSSENELGPSGSVERSVTE